MRKGYSIISPELTLSMLEELVELLSDEVEEELSDEVEEELSDEVPEELSDEISEVKELSLMGGTWFFFLQAVKASIPQQSVRESAKVNSFFIQSS